MLQKLRNLSIASKLALLALLSILLVLSSLTIYAVSASKNTLMATEIENLKQKNQLVIDMIDAYHHSLKRPTETLLKVFRGLFPETFTLSQNSVQVSHELLPMMLADSDEVNNQTFQVDRLQALTSAVSTIFVKRGDDFYRASTSVLDPNQQRVLGTPLSKASPAYAALTRGESYFGPVALFGKNYMGGYEPIRNPNKEVIGAFFVGMDFEGELAALKQKIKEIKIGKTGYYVVVDATPGERYGTMLIHPTLEGKNSKDVRDADGNLLVKESLGAKNGVKRYRWIDKSESTPREKIASFSTYENWQWLVFGSSYVDEFAVGARALSRNLILASLLSGTLLALALYYFLRQQIGIPLAHASAIAKSVAAGDLTQKIDIHRDDETGKLLASLQTMSDSLARVARTVHERSTLIQDGVRQITKGNADISQRSEEQASTLEETAASVESVSAAAKENAAIAAQGRKLATDAANAAAENATVMARLGETINSMHQSSKQIGDIVGVIDGLAFQTNILALNAAVEAARAGEQGRGFAVVASEVRSLAQRSSQSAKDIRAIISQSTATMETGTKLAHDVAKSSQVTQRSIQMVTELIGQIADGSREQSISVEQINQAMEQLDHVTQQNAALVEEASAAAQSLEEQSYHLLEAVKLLRFDRNTATTGYSAVALPDESITSSLRKMESLPPTAETKRLLKNYS
jgi:methyl-accepting chemotaxis protein